MLKYRRPQLVRAGFLGVIIIALVIAVGLHPQRLLSWATTVRYQAYFAEAGGLLVGNDVKVSGIKVGDVSGVSVTDDGRAVVTFRVDATVRLGSETTAHIRTGSLLGARVLTLESAGNRRLEPSSVIPMSRTASPYSLTEAVSDLTDNAAGTDVSGLNQSLDTLSATVNLIAPQLGPVFDGLTRLSRSLNNRSDSLRDFLKNASSVTAILAERSQKVDALILNGNDLLGTLVSHRQAISELLANISVVAQQLTGVVADNESKLAPTLDRLNSIAAMLEQDRDTIAKALPGLKKLEFTLGETVSNGFYYSAYVPNLIPGQFLQPFFDYYFGFRRGTDAGQPPDNAGPRAEFPFPRNAIPGGSR